MSLGKHLAQIHLSSPLSLIGMSVVSLSVLPHEEHLVSVDSLLLALFMLLRLPVYSALGYA